MLRQSTKKAAEVGICAIKQLIEDVGLPSKLADVDNADRRDIPKLVELYQNNPNIAGLFGTFMKRTATREEVIKLFEDVFNGVLKSKM